MAVSEKNVPKYLYYEKLNMSFLFLKARLNSNIRKTQLLLLYTLDTTSSCITTST